MDAVKRGELTSKDMGVLRETTSARTQHKRTSGELKEYGLNHAVTMSWRQQVDRLYRPFYLHIDDKKYILSWAELKELDRDGFFRREIQPRVTLKWGDGPKIQVRVDLNKEAERDMIVLFVTDDKDECYIDIYEMMKIGRFI